MSVDVMVSYSRNDWEEVRGVVQQLQSAGVSVWIDVKGIDAASLWGQEIVEAIDGCKVLILVISESSVASSHVLREVTLAVEGKKHILPVFLEPVAIPGALRYQLAGIQQIHLFGEEREEKFHALLGALIRLGVQSAPSETGEPRLGRAADSGGGRTPGGGRSTVTAQVAGTTTVSRTEPTARMEGAETLTPKPNRIEPPKAVARVAVLYKRSAQPDEQVLQLLETQLSACGCQLFIDRHLPIGVEWAKEIERQIRTSDAVIPLLSSASMQSEMLQYEVQIAHEAAQQNEGKPRLLPVRVNYVGPLPESLATLLDPLEYGLWEGPQDDERLVANVVQSLRNPAASKPVVPRSKLESVGGAVPLDSAFYVVRRSDDEFQSAILRHDSIVLVKGARQIGKTSLLARGLQQAREAGARVVLTGFQKLNAAHLESAEALFLTLSESIADQLDLDVLPEEVWNARRGPSVNFERYLRREVLDKTSTPIVWGMDEVDRLFTCEFGSEVFGLFRSWHNERALDPSGPWSRLTLAIAYATEAHLFITDVNQSPFNVGTRLTLDDLTFEQVADLNERYGSPLRDQAEIASYYRLVSGQPYLVRRGLHEMTTHSVDIAAFEAEADRDEGIFGDHLRRFLVLLVKDPELREVVRGVLRGRPCPTAETFYRLRSAGLMAGESARDARPRCQLYATYLEQHLL
jgi:AAA-like domain/TIR domain